MLRSPFTTMAQTLGCLTFLFVTLEIFYSSWLLDVSNSSVPFCSNARVRCRSATSWPLQPCQPTQTFTFFLFQQPTSAHILTKNPFSHFFWFSAGDSCWYLLQTRVNHGTLLRARCSDDLRGERLWYTHPHSWVLWQAEARSLIQQPPRTFPPTILSIAKHTGSL